ncbi:MAG: hypothetical protein N3A69_12860 [Leptospiraceae bacterium]|nr:hypothetical protein [Leptospiraceae bacterium]
MRQTAIQYYTYLAKNALELANMTKDIYLKEVMSEGLRDTSNLQRV